MHARFCANFSHRAGAASRNDVETTKLSVHHVEQVGRHDPKSCVLCVQLSAPKCITDQKLLPWIASMQIPTQGRSF